MVTLTWLLPPLLHSLLSFCRVLVHYVQFRHRHGSFVCVIPQEFLSDREHGQARLSTVDVSGDLLMAVVSRDRVEGIKAKVENGREDWKSLMNNLQMREDALKVGWHLCVNTVERIIVNKKNRYYIKHSYS